MSLYRVGGIGVTEVVTRAIDAAKKKIRDEAAAGAKAAVAPVARKEAAEGARSAVKPMIVGVAALSALSLVVALRR